MSLLRITAETFRDRERGKALYLPEIKTLVHYDGEQVSTVVGKRAQQKYLGIVERNPLVDEQRATNIPKELRFFTEKDPTTLPRLIGGYINETGILPTILENRYRH